MLVFFSLKVTRECEDQGFAKHPSIASENKKISCHNSPFETLELHDTRIKGVEGSIKDINQKITTKDKQLSTTTQKSDDVKEKWSNLESRIVKLKKK